MRTHSLACISALVLLVSLSGCAVANSAGTAQPADLTATSPAASPSGSSGSPASASGSAAPTTGTPGATAPASGGATPDCGADLKVTVFGGAAAASTIAGAIGFTNTGSAPCRLAGYPVVTGVTASGAEAVAGHLLSTEFGPNITRIAPVTLAPRAMAVSVITGNEVAGPCVSGRVPTFRSLLVQPPGSTGHVTVSALLPELPGYLPDCGGINGPINVTPVVPAASLGRQGPQ